ERSALHASEPVVEQLVGARLNAARDVCSGGAAMRRIVLETTIVRRIVGWRDHDAVCQAGLPSTIMGKDRMRNSRRRGETLFPRNHHVDAVGSQYFHRAFGGGPGKRMGV